MKNNAEKMDKKVKIPAESFTIEDAFCSDDDERLNGYGSVHASPSNTPKIRLEIQTQSPEEEEEEIEYKKVDRPTSHLLPSPSGGSHRKSSTHSDVTHVTTRSFTENSLWLLHPKIRENWRVVFGAFMLTLIGSVLFCVGVGIVISPYRGMHSLVFFIGGLLCLIPGAYHLVYIYLAVKEFEGFSLYDLPVFN